MRPYVLTAISLVSLVLPVGATRQDAVDLSAFTGTWREGKTRTQMAPRGTMIYTFTEEADSFVTITRSGGVELRDRARLDGKDYLTPDVPGRTVSWTRISDTVYETTIKRDGALVARGRWTIVDSGKRLIQETIPVRVDDRTVTNAAEYVRIAGDGEVLFGQWKPVASRSGEPDLFVITVIDGDALRVYYPRNGNSYIVRCDGKEYELVGPNTFPDMTSLAVSLGPRSFRRTTFRAKAPLSETEMTVAADGRTLFVTTRPPGSAGPPSTYVYEKQN